MPDIIGNIVQGNFTWAAFLIVLSVFLDIFLILYIKKKDIPVKNKYFELHVNFGVKKLNSIKIFFAVLFLWQASKPVRYNPLSFFLSLLIYLSIVLKLLFDFIKRLNSAKR